MTSTGLLPPPPSSVLRRSCSVKNVGMARAPETVAPAAPAKNAIVVHGATELENDVRALPV